MKRVREQSVAALAAALLITIGVAALPLPARAVPPELPIKVSNTGDSGVGSLRQAILNANTRSGPDTIVFDIGAAGPQVIAPQSDLPTVTDPVTIDGYTQPGAAPATANSNAVLAIVIDARGRNHGLDIAADDCEIKGLVVQNASTGAGIGIQVTGTGNTVSGNYLGTTANGLAGAGNSGPGVVLDGDANTVGGPMPGDRNLISSNNGNGVTVASGTGNRVVGNRIGTNVNGLVARGNRDGVGIEADGTEVTGNLLSGNRGDGLSVGAAATVLRNRVGTTAGGNAALPNGRDGITVRAADVTIGRPAEGNLVSANTDDGIAVEITAGPGVTIQGNTVGTTLAGAPLGNGDDGIAVYSGDVLVGGTQSEGNVVAANADHGVVLFGDGSTVSANTIGGPNGAAALGNGGEGIEVLASDTRVTQNTISQNGAAGVQVSSGNGNSLPDNSISGNAGLGIDLGAVGTTPNDPGDIDVGDNDLMNHPTVVGVTTSNGRTTVVWKIDRGLPSSIQQLDFFSQALCDASGHGEGLKRFASVTVPTDALGQADGQFVVPALIVPVGRSVAATATLQTQGAPQTLGSTSEFSPCTTVTA